MLQKGCYSAKIKYAKTFLTVILRKFIPLDTVSKIDPCYCVLVIKNRVYLLLDFAILCWESITLANFAYVWCSQNILVIRHYFIFWSCSPCYIIPFLFVLEVSIVQRWLSSTLAYALLCQAKSLEICTCSGGSRQVPWVPSLWHKNIISERGQLTSYSYSYQLSSIVLSVYVWFMCVFSVSTGFWFLIIIMIKLLHAKSRETQGAGNDRPWLLLKTINAKSSSLKLMPGPLQVSRGLASRPGRLKYGLVSIAWVIVHMRKLSSPESGEFVHVSKSL